MTTIPTRAIPGLAAAALSPSAHNTQPWVFKYDGSTTTVGWNPGRELPAGDPGSRYLFTGLGAALESMVLGAAGEQLAAQVKFRHSMSSDAVATIVYKPGIASRCDLELCDAIADRRTTRLGFRFEQVPQTSVEALSKEAAAGGCRLAFVADPNRIRTAASIVATATRLNFEHSAVYREFYSWLRLDDQHPRYSMDGLTLESLGLGRLSSLLAPHVMSPERMDWMIRLRVHRLMARTVGKLITRSPMLCLLLAASGSPEDLMSGGRAMIRVWLRATVLGLKVHPVTAAMDHEATRVPLAAVFDESSAASMIVCFRLGFGPDAPRSPRLPLDAIVVG